MSRRPPGRTDRDAPRPAVSAVVAAMLAAWAAPFALGLVLYGTGQVLPDGGLRNTLVLIGIVGIYSPILSWAGVIPAAGLHLVILRAGYGGWLATVVAGLVCGLVLRPVVGPLAVLCAGPVALVYWEVLRRQAPASLVAPPDAARAAGNR